MITGATGGLGQEIARQCQVAGATLILVSRSLEKLKALKLSEATLYAVDLSSPEAVHRFTEQFDRPVDILINNAAVQGPVGSFWENEREAFENTLQVNLLTPIALIRACLPGMMGRTYGKIINISGGGAAGPRSGFSSYATSKAALVRFSETLAAELKPYHIDVNCVAPGAMPTAMFQGEADPQTIVNAAKLCLSLSMSDGITGKLISAVWDPWQRLDLFKDQLASTDIYTLRRIVPEDRGLKWHE